MDKIATITFHRAHNFGSVLQTYALQEYICKMYKECNKEIQYQVIDFCSTEQKDLYSVFKPNVSWKNVIKNIITIPYAKKLQIKHRKFETFIEEEVNLTKKYCEERELLENPPVADYYISGSDQLWNVRTLDFSDVYYLNFVKSGKKLSYAASFGPLKIDWQHYVKEKYSHLLNDYDAISVRELGSKRNVEYLTGKQCQVNIDPTLLLSCNEWRKIQSNVDYNNGQYILLYCLEPTKKQLEIANAISGKLKLPIVILRYNNKNDMINRYVKKYESGPKDFLAYIDHAALVLSSSFHGTAYSLIYHKSFYVFDGMKDNRISEILRKTEMTERSIDSIKDIERVTLKPVDREKIDIVLAEERKRSKLYFQKVLQLKK